jgi:hypothetical protein
MDASGGVAEAKIVFQFAADPLQGLVYHLGQAYVTVSGAAGAVAYTMKTASMGYGGLPFALAMTGSLVQTQTEANLNGDEVTGMKNHLLGMPMATGDDATLECAVINTNGDVLLFTAMGYVWSQLAIGQAGFPKLPPGAIWPG